MNNKSFNICLTNKYLVQGIPADLSSEKGIMKFRFPENITLPSHAQIEVVNMAVSENMPPQPIILSIEELPNLGYIGSPDTSFGRRIKGFLGVANTDLDAKKQFGVIDLNNSNPINVQELTLKFENPNGLLSDINEPDESTFYDLEAVNTWQRDDGLIFTMQRLDETHFKLYRPNAAFFLEFLTPVGGRVGGNSVNTFVLDPAVQVPQTDPNLTLNLVSSGLVRTFTPFGGAGLTSPIPFQGVVNDFCINIKVKQDPQFQHINILRETAELMKGMISQKEEFNQERI